MPVCTLIWLRQQNLGARRNVEAVLGKNPLFWCCPTPPPGNGLKYQLAEGQGKWIELQKSGEVLVRDEREYIEP